MPRKELVDTARRCHEVCRKFDELSGIEGIRPWEELEASEQGYIVEAVIALRSGGVNASRAHDVWVDRMIKDGWIYGKTLNEEAMTHPDLIDYRSLPPYQKTKDKLFKAIAKQAILN